jgi:phenylpropionate dioxygenase-like ring-hydroxylating dioxygenase large terminal subunit
MPEKPRAVFSGHISAKPANVLENFLEGSHTHYVHNGWVRTSNKKRQKIEAQLIPGDNGFEVQYQQEPAKGILTKLVPKRNRHLRAVSTYIYPFTAALEYFNNENKPVFRVEMILSPAGNETSYYARVYLQIGVLSGLAVSVMKPLLANVIRQDKRILEQQEQNLSSGKSARFFSDDTDLVGKQIFSWLFDREHIARKPTAFTVWW